MTTKDQIPTEAVPLSRIMSHPSFAHGVRDARAKKPYPFDFDDWDTDSQWNYERGRQWGVRTPRSVVLKRDGKLTAEALRWAARLGEDIVWW